MSIKPRGITHMNVYVHNKGEPEDYINLPVVKDGIAIGIVSDCVFDNWKGYKLTLTIWTGLEIINGKPSAIVLN